jgi:hypothetical protein
MTLCNAGSGMLGWAYVQFENAFRWAVLTTAIRQTLSHVTFAILTEAKSVEVIVPHH